MLEFASFSEGGKSRLFCLVVLVPVHREPTSGLEPLAPAHDECAARHLGAIERLPSRTAAFSPQRKHRSDLELNAGCRSYTPM
jgi:hypothetical protein